MAMKSYQYPFEAIAIPALLRYSLTVGFSQPARTESIGNEGTLSRTVLTVGRSHVAPINVFYALDSTPACPSMVCSRADGMN